MIKIEKAQVLGWEAAIRGTRNPLNSWDRSDSKYVITDEETYPQTVRYEIGSNDLALMKRLSEAGPDHGKFLRMIVVYMDVTAPLYWWKEFDTYKVGTVANSCSTMHKIDAKEFTVDDFSFDTAKDDSTCREVIDGTISLLNKARDFWLKTKDKKYWRFMIEMLPSSYNQKRTIELNYQVLKNMYFARRNHKLTEWHGFCDWIRTLPYAEELITGSKSTQEGVS